MTATATMSPEELTQAYWTLQGTVQRLQEALGKLRRLHRKDILVRYGWSESTLERRIREGRFPRAVSLGGHPFWRLEDLEAAEIGGQIPRPVSA